MWYRACRLDVREAISRSVVSRRWLAVHLAVRTAWLTEALRSAVRFRFRSFLPTGDLIALDFDGLLRFDQILT